MKPDFTKKPEFMVLAAEQKQRDYTLIGELLRFFLVLIIGTVAQALLLAIPETIWLANSGRFSDLREAVTQGGDIQPLLMQTLEDMPPWLVAVVGMTGIMLGVAAIVYCVKFEKRSPETMGLEKRGLLKQSLLGFALGALLASAVVGIAALFRGVQIRGPVLTGAMLPTLLLFFLSFLLQSVGETLMLQGYLTVSLSKRQRLSVCIIIAALVYAFMHSSGFGNRWVDFLNQLLFGAVLGLLMLKTGRIWAVILFRALWHFGLSCIFYFTEDGSYVEYALFGGKIVGHNDLLTGGAAGLESSLCATLVLLAVIGGLIALLLRTPPDEPEEEENPEF